MCTQGRENERASPILGGSRHKSDRIFIDAKLAISSPVTIPELCISLGDSRSEVYPSRLFPPRSPTSSGSLPRREFSSPSSRTSSTFSAAPSRLSSPPRASRPPSRPYSPLGTLHVSRRIATPFRAPYPPHPSSAGNVTYWSNERVEKETIPTDPTNHGERPR